ncbi:MAG: M1 family metallopeptidase [Myxococcales bacterium]|nr:M1 family metallopeptidase [Myxococcales bacterium]
MIALLGCQGARPGATAEAPRAPLPEAVRDALLARPMPPAAPTEHGRLPRVARPERYSLELFVDPSRPRFRGVATVQLTMLDASRTVVLHGRGLNVTAAEASSADGARQRARVASRRAEGSLEDDELVFAFDAPLSGTVSLTVAYDAPFSRGVEGLYRVEVDGAWYAFTDFEPSDARRAFPCLDEPDAKAVFSLTLHTPSGQRAFANMPAAETAPEPGGAVTRFAETPRLSSYLVAFAVGPFDVYDGPTQPVPVRVITVRGRAALGALAAETAATMLPVLGAYFDRPYPYPKLDLVAVPDFAHGAMENPGLITYRDSILLHDRARASVGALRAMAGTTAHELAHQWFGNLVTMRWWDDLWLNEGFATWITPRIVESWQASLPARVDAAQSLIGVRTLDALPTAHAIRVPVESTAEAVASFDGTTYAKGAAVIGMLEAWLGPEVFRRGVRAYIAEHALGNARAEDLLHALGAASGFDVARVAGAFLDRPGVPLVEATLRCAPRQHPSLVLRQSRFLVERPEGAPEEAPWVIPVCVRYDRGPGLAPGERCEVFDQRERAVTLGGTRCPRWINPNARTAGYYFWRTSEANVRTLMTTADRTVLDVPARLDLLANLQAQVLAGQSPIESWLIALDRLARDFSPVVYETVATQLFELERRAVTDADRPRFARWVRSLLQQRARRMGWRPVHGDVARRDDFPRMTHYALGMLGDDPETLTAAEGFAARWLRDNDSVDADLAGVALPLASRRGDAARYDALLAAHQRARTPQAANLALASLFFFDDPALVHRARDRARDGAVRVADLRVIFSRVGPSEAHRRQAADWVHDHFGALVEARGNAAQGALGLVASRCTEAELEADRAALTPLVARVEGAARPFAVALESAHQCARQREALSAGLHRWLTLRMP